MTAVSTSPSNGTVIFDAPRDKRTYFREINYIAAAFQYQKKNYNSA
ncbi:glucosamine-6-phosphate deaminase [Escherichia coli]|nr:glucosamine-6-phosphate deaminase [Escherichia coli]